MAYRYVTKGKNQLDMKYCGLCPGAWVYMEAQAMNTRSHAPHTEAHVGVSLAPSKPSCALHCPATAPGHTRAGNTPREHKPKQKLNIVHSHKLLQV